LKVHRSRSVRRAEVLTNGKNLVSHAGTALVCELADRSGLTREMSGAMDRCGISWHTHDPGVVLTHLAVAIADGADCLSDLSSLREQQELFGPVASIPTAWRALQATSSLELREIGKAVAAARAKVWAVSPPGDGLVIDFDATLVTSFSEKQDAAATYKHGYGFHPLGAWCDTTAEPLAAMLRPGNAGSNDADDHLELWTRRSACCRSSTSSVTSPVIFAKRLSVRSSSAPTPPVRHTASSVGSSRPTVTFRSGSPSLRR
jgi:hypothetical protein